MQLNFQPNSVLFTHLKFVKHETVDHYCKSHLARLPAWLCWALMQLYIQEGSVHKMRYLSVSVEVFCGKVFMS
jgi:hypothetical protein